MGSEQYTLALKMASESTTPESIGSRLNDDSLIYSEVAVFGPFLVSINTSNLPMLQAPASHTKHLEAWHSL